ncbi:MAG TPA: hypothetical protein VLT33_43665 [Labilithrix sp.]|nr:hypothetical protein [Labilithrix sp.]
MVRKIAASLAVLAALGPVAVACGASRTGELEPRYVAVHNTLAAMGLAQVGPIQQGSLAEGRETRMRVDLLAQCTTIVAIGGPGVRDLEVSLLDPDDKPVAHDTTKEPQATLRTCPASAGHYTLVVKMAAGAGDFVAASWAGGGLVPAGTAAAASAAVAGSGAGTCESPLLLAPGLTVGNTRRGEAENAGGCASSDSKELVYKLEVTRRQRVSIEVDPQFDSVLYVRKDECGETDSEIACNDDATAGAGKRGASSRGSRIDEVLEPGTYFVFVDGYGAETGPFKMDVQIADVPTLADACRQIRPLGSAKISATLTGSFDHAHASCGADAKGPDALHRFDLNARSRVRITEHSADFTPAVHLRKQCADEHSEVACADSGIKADEATWAGVLDPGSYVLFADSADKDARGRYTLETELGPEAGTGVRGDACGDALTLGLSERAVEGDTFAARDDLGGKCGGQGAPDVVYRFDLPRRSRVTARFAEQESAHTFVMMKSCTDRASEIACGPIVDEVLAPGVYYLAVDGAAADALGRYTFAFLARDVSAQEGACRAPPTLVDGQTVSGTTVNAGDKFTTSCAGREDQQASADRLYKLTLGARAKVKLVLTTPTWDGVLAIRKSCLDPPRSTLARTNEAACNNDFQDTRHAKIEATLEAGTYFVVVDGHLARNEGAYTLELKTSKP